MSHSPVTTPIRLAFIGLIFHALTSAHNARAGFCACTLEVDGSGGSSYATPEAGDSWDITLTITNTGNQNCEFEWTDETTTVGTFQTSPSSSASPIMLAAGASTTETVTVTVPTTNDASLDDEELDFHVLWLSEKTCDDQLPVCIIPSDIDVTWQNWHTDTDKAGIGRWQVQLLPLSVDFGHQSRRVTERTSPGLNGTDGCFDDHLTLDSDGGGVTDYDEAAAGTDPTDGTDDTVGPSGHCKRFTSLPSGPGAAKWWVVDSPNANSLDELDSVGRDTECTNDVQSFMPASTSCRTEVPQTWAIKCRNSWVEFEDTSPEIAAEVSNDPDHVTSEHDGPTVETKSFP